MKQLGILFLMLVIYPFALFAADSLEVKNESGLLSPSLITDSTIQNNFPLISTDSVITAPVIPFTVPSDTSEKNITEPEILKTDTINPLESVPLIVPDDSTAGIKIEVIKFTDSLTVKTDSLMVLDSLGKVKIRQDSVPRMEFRSVYVDSIEQGNPNFLPKSVLMIKWITDEKRDTVIRYKNLFGINAFYGSYCYGLGGGMFIRLSNDADFIANINFASVFDRRTEGDLDSTGTLRDLERESRLLTIIFNAGLEKYFMQNRTDWKIKPVLLFGFAPAIVFAAPYERSFFSSIFKSQVSYGLGVFAALGFDWQAFQKFGINLTARYAFIPIIGRDIYYYKGFLVKNVGGFYVNFGVTLLKEYFSKN